VTNQDEPGSVTCVHRQAGEGVPLGKGVWQEAVYQSDQRYASTASSWKVLGRGLYYPAVLSGLTDIPFTAGTAPTRPSKVREKGPLVSAAGFPALEVLLHRARITYLYDALLLALKCPTYQNMGSRSISFRPAPPSGRTLGAFLSFAFIATLLYFIPFLHPNLM